MTNEQNNEVKEAEVLTPAEMTDAIRVLMADSKNIFRSLDGIIRRLDEQDTKMTKVFSDLDNPRIEYGRTGTRQLAVAAYQQSEGFISTENLEGHKIIKDLGEELDKYVGQANNFFTRLRRQIETIPSPDNMQDLLSSNLSIKQILDNYDNVEQRLVIMNEKITEIADNEEELGNTYHGKDHPTREEFDEEILNYEELKIRHNDLVHFLKGVFAKMGFDPVAKCVAEYKIQAKERSEDDEEPKGTG